MECNYSLIGIDKKLFLDMKRKYRSLFHKNVENFINKFDIDKVKWGGVV